jgi:2-haloacid dehalogenase
MPMTLGFDVYGTLIDTAGIAVALREHAGERAPAFAAAWRAKQLEYAFRRGLMNRYRDFRVCTEQALEFCCRQFRVSISDADRASLMAAYVVLPAFPDARAGLESMRRAGLRLTAFSMGRLDDVKALLEHAGLGGYFSDVISLEAIQCYKPSPTAYRHFLDATGSPPQDAWLVSGNPFDVLGAVAAGLQGAWVKRSPDAVLDPWEIAPTVVADDLPALCDLLLARR